MRTSDCCGQMAEQAVEAGTPQAGRLGEGGGSGSGVCISPASSGDAHRGGGAETGFPLQLEMRLLADPVARDGG